MPRFATIGLLTVSLLFVSLAATTRAADRKPAPAAASVDYPLTVVAFASVDRVRARFASLAEVLGSPELADKLFVAQMGGDDEMQKLIELPGLDPTKPVGMMSYPNWFNADGTTEQPDMPDMEELFSDPIDFLFESLANLAVENSTIVICLPAKDRDELLASVGGLILDGDQLVPDPDQPGWYKQSKGEDARIGFVGNYLLVVVDDGETKHFDRNYPDFGKLAKASLGKNGFVYSLQKRGLPKLLREVGAEALQSTFAATLQRQDDEDEFNFRWRTKFGSLQTELLDVALSHVDEFRITGHVDSTTHAVIVETELVGVKDGKLAKFASGLTGKISPFANVSHDDAAIATNVSLGLNPKLWKPVADVLRSLAEPRAATELGALIRSLAKQVESGQLDLHFQSPDWKTGLVALRVPLGENGVEQFNEMLRKVPGDVSGDWKLSLDSVEGWPIHRLPSGLTLGPDTDFDVAQFLPQQAVFYEVEREVVDDKGNRRTVTEARQKQIPHEPHSLWLAATPQAIWVALSPASAADCPAWFKSAIESSLAKPNRASPASRIKTPFQMTLRGFGAAPSEAELAQQAEANSKIVQASATEDEEDKAERERGEILRDRPNAIRIEALPTATGLKLNVTFEEAYFHWYAAMLKHSLDEAASPPNNAAPPDARQPQPKPVD